MGKHYRETVTTFLLTGQFLGFEVEDGYKVKRFQLATSTGKESIKLSKEARASLLSQGLTLKPGDWIQVWGEQKLDETGVPFKFKAYRVTLAQPQAIPAPTAVATPLSNVKASTTAPPKSATVLVCRKSDCMNKGGRSMCRALEATLSKHGLEDVVSIKETGCMKNCKAGPNLVFMPNKAKYSRVRPDQVEELVTQHLLA